MEAIHALNQALSHLTLAETSDFPLHTLDQDGWFFDHNMSKIPTGGMVISLNAGTELVGLAVVSPAVGSYFQSATKMGSTALENTLFVSALWVSPYGDAAKLLPCLWYFALRRGRIWGKTNVVALLPEKHILTETSLLQPLSKLAPIEHQGNSFIPMAQRIKYALYRLYQKNEGMYLATIKKNIIAEIMEITNAWLDKLFKAPWAQAIMDQQLSKEQYISLLYNTYQYVRLTLRLIGRCIGFTEDMQLRDHYVYHLKGEINHELIIERDIKHLGADLEYMKYACVADPAMKEFMVVQESTIGFYQDTVLMLACPLAAEGVTANVKPEFLQALWQVIESWGIKNPKEAARFFASHIHTDGGDDGHWMHVIKMVERHVTDELMLQRFLGVLYGVMNGLEHGYNAAVQDLALWGPVH